MTTKKVNPAIEYIQESILEIRRVTWPTRHQAAKLTLVVLGFCLVSAVVVGAVDIALKIGYEQLVNLSK